MPADLTPIDTALLDRWAGALARLAEGPTEYGPHDVEALAATTERMVVENARLRAELAEALATLANERGEGEPPVEGFVWNGSAWWNGKPGKIGSIKVYSIASKWAWWIVGSPLLGDAATARAAIRDASAAKGGAR